jgi:ABC-type dipeptide/oligopeptide/nickel transport system permease subunit
MTVTLAQPSAPPLAAPRRRRRPVVTLVSRLGLVLALLIGLATLVGPLLWTIDPNEQRLAERLLDPTTAHPLGTDGFGRDILARLLTGARWSLAGAAIVCLGVNVLGFLIGALAATGRPRYDALLGRIVETLMALPGIVTALAVTAVLGPSFSSLLIALITTSWPWYARAYRSLILAERAAPYIEGAVALGAPPWRVLLRHLLPNVIGPAVVIATGHFGGVILSLASLSFLGLGMQPPTPEWGMMINEARGYFHRKPWQMLAPGLCIVLTVLAVNLTGDALRDLLDPRTRRR